jgi:hypothetical protein
MTAIADLVIRAGYIVASGANGGLWNWAALSGLAVMVSGVILALMYTWSALFRNQPLEAYVRQELYELVVSAVLAIFIIGLVGAMNDLTLGSFMPDQLLPGGGSTITHVDATDTVYSATAKYYARVTNDMEGWLNLNYLMNILIDQMASVTPYARPLGVGLVASPMAGFASPIKQVLYNMSVGLSVAYIINVAQLYVYVFALQAFMNYYMPLGIFFRCFTPTRRLGGTLIGVGVAFLFVFPALSTITYSMFYNKAGGPMLTFGSLIGQYISDQGSFADFVTNFFTSNFTTTGTGGPTFIDLVTGTFGLIGGLLQGVMGTTFLIVLIFPISIVSMAFVLGFVVPAFNVIIFTEAAKGLAKSFGEEVDISALTRLI